MVASYVALVLAWVYKPLMERFARISLSHKVEKTEQGTTSVLMCIVVASHILPVGFRNLQIGQIEVQEKVEWICVALIVLGYLLRYWSMSALGVFFTRTLKMQGNQKLIQDGPYSMVRHPGYAANLLVYISLGIACSHNILYIIISVVALSYGHMRRIYAEESMLELSDIGQEYKVYKKRTNALIPFVF